MSRRLNLAQAVIVPWQIPDIDAAALAAETPGFHERTLGAGDLVEPDSAVAQTAAKVNGAAAPPAEIADPRVAEHHAQGLERGLREGREQGYADGFAAGQRAAETAFGDHLRRIESVVRQLGEPMRSIERPVEEAVIALALEVARWVIGNEITVSRDHLVALVRDAIGKVPIDVGTPAIVLNQADAELIRALAPDLESNGIPLVVDDTIEPGGCLIVANGDDSAVLKDRRWHPRVRQAICEIDLTLASRWRDAMFAMFEGEDA